MRRASTTALLISIPVLLVAGTTSAQGSKLYKWVDEHGNVHYSDRIEGSASLHDPKRLSASGIQIGNAHSALPRNADEAREQRLAQRLAQRDTMLLASYGSELELLRAHDESRAAIEASVGAAEVNIARLREQLALREQRPDAASHRAAIDRIREQLVQEEAQLEQLRTRRFELHERQNEEVARFRELTTRNS